MGLPLCQCINLTAFLLKDGNILLSGQTDNERQIPIIFVLIDDHFPDLSLSVLQYSFRTDCAFKNVFHHCQL